MRITRDMAHSVSQGFEITKPTVCYCKFCNTILFHESSGTGFKLIKGPCDCSWKCCDKTQADDHEDHMMYRPAVEGDREKARRDFDKEKLAWQCEDLDQTTEE